MLGARLKDWCGGQRGKRGHQRTESDFLLHRRFAGLVCIGPLVSAFLHPSPEMERSFTEHKSWRSLC